MQEPKVLTFDVVGTLIDFEGGVLNYLRQNVPQTRSMDDDTILKAYRESRRKKTSVRYPDNLVQGYEDIAERLGCADQGPGRGSPGFREDMERLS